jgi:hypothetical protein
VGGDLAGEREDGVDRSLFSTSRGMPMDNAVRPVPVTMAAMAGYTTAIFCELVGLLARDGAVDLQELGNGLLKRARESAMTDEHEITAVYIRELGNAFIDATQPLSIPGSQRKDR